MADPSMSSKKQVNVDGIDASSVNPLSSTASPGSPVSSSDVYGGSVVIEQLKSDPLYRHFLDDDFDAKSVAAKAVENLAITDHLAKIAAG